MLALASAVEADSEHPIAKTIVSGASRRGIGLQQSANFKALPGARSGRDRERT
jgi:Cu2+-exporting ATPase